MVYLASLEGLSASRSLPAVTPISAKSGLPDSAGRRSRHVDLATRLKGRVRSLRVQLERRDALLEAIREVNATVDPKKVAGWLVHRARTWIPCPCWAVVARDMKGDLTVIADEGLTPDLMPSLWVATQWVMRQGSELLSGDLRKDSGKPAASGSAVAFPLVCRNRPIGVVVGLDPRPSAALPAFSASLSLALRSMLEPPAIALDNALSLQRAEAQ